MRIIFSVLFFNSALLLGMTGKEIKKNLLPYMTVNIPACVTAIRFTKQSGSDQKMVVGTQNIHDSLTSSIYLYGSDGVCLGSLPDANKVDCLDVCPGSPECVSNGNQMCRVWDLEKLKLKEQFLVSSNGDPIVSLEYNKGGKQLLCAHDTMAQIWDLESDDYIHTLNGHIGGIYSACWSSDNSQVATVGADNTIKLWDTRTGGLLKMEKLPGKKSTIAYNNDDLIAADLYLYVYEPVLAFCRVFDLEGQTVPIKGSRLERNTSMPHARSLAFISGKPEYVIVGVDDGTVCICDQADTSHSLKINAAACDRRSPYIGQALATSPEGTVLAVGSFLEQAVRLWKVSQLVSHTGKSTELKRTPGQNADCCIIN